MFWDYGHYKFYSFMAWSDFRRHMLTFKVGHRAEGVKRQSQDYNRLNKLYNTLNNTLKCVQIIQVCHKGGQHYEM